MLSQHYHISFPISVNELVLMGRYPFFAARPSSADLSICAKAMEVMDVSHLADRDYNTLSGGEAQKVQMSRVLAQIWQTDEREGKILFLDEPVSHLDVKYQHQLLSAAKDLCAHRVTVIAILHDINLSINFADRLLFMKNGHILHDLQEPGRLHSEMIKEVFDVNSEIWYPAGDRPVVVFGK